MKSSRRLRLFLSHLSISAAVVGVVAAIVLLVWYPRPLFNLQGVLIILGLLVLVDVIIGPLLTLVVANPRKGRRELIRDLMIIGIVQVAALGYGVQSLFVARPAFIVFNADRFDVVVANELERDAPFQYRDRRFASTPLLGPIWVAARSPDDTDQRNKLLFAAAGGGPDIRHYPALYSSWPAPQGINSLKLRPLQELMLKSSEGKQAVVEAMRRSGLQENELVYVPLVGREGTGVVIMDKSSLQTVLASAAVPTY